jgi:uncharacterized protein
VPTAAEVARLGDQDGLLNAEVLVATTWECNLRCSYCFVKHRPLQGWGDMSPAIARHLIDALDSEMEHVESICVHAYGGEPLSNLPALHALVEAAEAKPAGRFSFAITTNGTLLSDEIIELLDRGKFQVILSIDGPPEVHNACRTTGKGAPTHAKTLKFLFALKKSTSCWVRGSAVVRRGWRLRDAERYLRTLPVDAIKAQAVRVADTDPLALSHEERLWYFEDLEDVGRIVIQELEAGIRPLDDRFSNRVLQILQGSSRDSFCGAGNTTFGFMPDGTVTPCVLLGTEDQHLGHIDEVPGRWINAGGRWRAGRARSYQDVCQPCTAFSLCAGGCPAVLSVCGADECEITRKNCEIAYNIYRHFADRPEKLLLMAGIE